MVLPKPHELQSGMFTGSDDEGHLFIVKLNIAAGRIASIHVEPAFACEGECRTFYERLLTAPYAEPVEQKPFDLGPVQWLLLNDPWHIDAAIYFVHVEEPVFAVEMLYEGERLGGVYAPNGLPADWTPAKIVEAYGRFYTKFLKNRNTTTDELERLGQGRLAYLKSIN